MTKRLTGMIVAVILVIGAIAAWKIITVRALIAKMSAMKPPPVTVSATEATEETWQPRLHAVGTFAAVQGVMLTNELDGTVAKIAFESGAHVKQGDLLVQLDISSEQAQLASAQATADLAQINLKRAQELRKKDTNSQADLDTSAAVARQTAASLDEIRAVIAKKTLRAPFSGRLGIRQVNVGQFLKAGTAVVPLQAMDPLYVNFSLPQQDVTDLKPGQTVNVTVDAYPGVVFEGKINAINSKVDDTNRNVLVQATVANADERIKPGMFAVVDVVLAHENKFVTVPLAAITYNPYGDSVYVVESKDKGGQGTPELTVRQQFVQLGDRRGDQVAIVKGVKAGERIVTAGQLKLRNGVGVQINDAVPVENNPAPKLPNT
jgi:membrane fusion protein (multidrug efflux system)